MDSQINKRIVKISAIILFIVLFWLSLFALDQITLTGLVTQEPIVWTGPSEFETAGEFRLDLTEHFTGNTTLTFYTSAADNLSLAVENNILVAVPQSGFSGSRQFTVYASNGENLAEQEITLRVTSPQFGVRPPQPEPTEPANETPAPAPQPDFGIRPPQGLGFENNVLRKDSKFIGRKITDSPIEITFDTIEQTNTSLILEFHHDSNQTETVTAPEINFTQELQPGEIARLEIPLVQGIIPKFRLKAGLKEGIVAAEEYKEILEIGKTIPQVNSNAQSRLIDRNDDKLDLELNKNSSRALIKGINASQIISNFGSASRPEINTLAIAASPVPIEQAAITLPKTGPVNTIVKCTSLNTQTLACQGEWQPTDIPFTQNATHITFTVDSFSGYAGAQLEVINVQSYPAVSGNWTVEFTTQGTANLSITAVENTTWTDFSEDSSLYDLKFLELKCGQTPLNYTWFNNSVFYPNYSCNQTGSETSKVLTAGKHTLEFRFGNDTDYAYNLASANLTCAVRQTNCNAGEIGVMRMSNTSNAHAELINETDYDYLVCCQDNDNRNNLTNTSGTNIVNLSSATDAHAEVPGTTDYAYPVYLGAEPDNITCTYEEVSGSCSANKTCLFTLSNTTDGHVGDCTSDPYSLSVCCGFQIINRAPDTTQVILNSSLGTNYTDEDLSCYANVADVDNDTLTVYYKWYNNSVEYLSGSTSGLTQGITNLITTLGSGNTTKGETWTCSVKANDGTVNETDWNNASLTIKNTAPSHSGPYAAAHQPTEDTVDANLVAYWQFEHQDDKENKAIDALGIYNGTLNGTTHTDDGRIGSAYEFDGVDDNIHVNNNMANDNMSLVGWINPKESTGYIATEGIPNTGIRFRLRFATNKLGWGCYHGGWVDVFSDNIIPTDEWTHFAAVIDSSVNEGMKLYINGVQQADTDNISGCSPYGTFYLGTYIWPFGSYFNGTIDEVMIYNRSLSANEIQDIYLNGHINSSSTVTTDQDLGASSNNTADADDDSVTRIYNWYRNGTSITVLNMPFETNSSTTTKDYSPYDNNGTITGAVWTNQGRNGSTGAYVFSNDIINVGNDASLSMTDNISTSMWIKPTVYETYYATHLINKWTGTSDANYVIYFFGNYTGNNQQNIIRVYANRGGTWGPVSGSYRAPLNVWTHVGWTYNSVSGGQLYINGQPTGSLTSSGLLATNTANTKIDSGGFDGSIDDVMIFNRTLTAEQMEALYNLEYNRIVSQETAVGDVWSAEVTPNDMDTNTDGLTYQTNNVTIENSLPEAPTLLIPENNDTIITPSPEFIWSNSLDSESDTLTYQILVDDSPNFDAPEINTTGIAEGTTNTTYNATVELVLDKVYYWKVRANDSYGYGSFSSTYNFTLASQLSINLVRDYVNFSGIYPNQTEDTSDNTPQPFLVENTGNLYANITVIGTKFFDLSNFPSSAYMFKIDLNESGAFNYGQSTTTYTNMTNVSSRIDIADLDWRSTNDTAEIDINITVPLGEPQGVKTSNVTLTVT